MSEPEPVRPSTERPGVAARWVWGSLVIASALGALFAFFSDPHAIERGSGWLGLTLLLGTLSITPLRHLVLRLSRRRSLVLAIGLLRARRPLGLAAFGAAAVHALVSGARYLGTPSLAQVRTMLTEVAWLRHGALALALLLVLAITSLRPIARRMRAWQGLHRLIYPAALLVGLHALLGPHAGTGAAIASGVTILLLVARALPSRRRPAEPRDNVEA